MTLFINNLKGLAIHLLMSFVAILLTLLGIILSPIYPSYLTAFFTWIFLYIVYLMLYLKLCCWLTLEHNKRHDYLTAILSLLVGVILWGITLIQSPYLLSSISEDLSAYWIPYNTYILPSWPFLYGQQNPLLLLLGSLSPCFLLLAGLKLHRYKQYIS